MTPLLALLAFSLAGPPAGPLARQTLLLFLLSLGISLPLSLCLALALGRMDLPGRQAAGLLIGSLLLIPLYVHVAAWEAGFGLQGWMTLRLTGGSSPWLAGLRGAAWIHGLGALPWMTLVILVGVHSSPRPREELRLLEAPWPIVIGCVTLPHALPAIWVAALWLLAVVLSEITVTDCYQVRTLAEELYTGFALAGSVWQLHRRTLPATLVGLSLPVAVGLAVAVGNRLTRWASSRRPIIYRPHGWRWPLTAGMWLLVLLAVGVPVGNLAYQAGLRVTLAADGPHRTWSASHGAAMIVRACRTYGDEITGSLLVAQLVAATALCAASPIAWWSRSGTWRLGVALGAVAICLALPAPLIAVWLIGVLNQPGWGWFNWLYDRTIVPVVMVHTVKAAPLAFLVLWPAMRGVPSSLIDLASLDGWSWIIRYIRLGLRLTLPVHAVAWIVVAATSLAELSATILIVPPGFSTLAVTIFQLVHYGVEDRLAGLCLLVWGGTLMLAVLVWVMWISWRRAERSIMDQE